MLRRSDPPRRYRRNLLLTLGLLLLLPQSPLRSAEATPPRIFIVSSYHREYLWSQDTQRGVVAALLKGGLLNDEKEGKAFTEKDALTTETVVLKKTWMDTKRKNSRKEIGETTNRIVKEIDAFKPDVILLGDDNAANYIGNQYLDTGTPVVFWGINGDPMKYGQLDSLEEPGHNITGVYQAGYLKECLDLVKTLVPEAKTFGILSDDSPTGRAKVKQLQQMAAAGKLPLKLVGVVRTNSYDDWKKQTLALEKKVDAFFMLNHNSIKDGKGNPIDAMEIGAWYLNNIKKPECAHERQFAVEGMLCVCDDSGYNQGFDAMSIALDVVLKGKDPARIPVRHPKRGPRIVNLERAEMLKISIPKDAQIEETVKESLALKRSTRP